VELPDVAETSLRVTSENQKGMEAYNTYNFPNIVQSEFCIWQAIIPKPHKREAPLNLQRTVRWVHSI